MAWVLRVCGVVCVWLLASNVLIAPPAAAQQLTLATCLERQSPASQTHTSQIHLSQRARALRAQAGVFRIDEGGAQPDGAANAAPRSALRGTAHLVDAHDRDHLFLTSAHTFRRLLGAQRSEAQTSTIEGLGADGARVTYTIYLFPGEVSAPGFNLWRPLISACTSNTTDFQGSETFGFKIARLTLVDTHNRDITIVGARAIDAALLAQLQHIITDGRPTANLYDFALLRSGDWSNPQAVQAATVGAQIPSSDAAGGSAGTFYGYGHRDARTGVSRQRSLHGTVLGANVRPQYDSIGGGAFRGDSGSLVFSPVGDTLLGAGLVTFTRATSSAECLLDDAVSIEQSPGGQALVAYDNGESLPISSQCLSVLLGGVEVSPLYYLSEPAWLFFFEPFSRTSVPRIETAAAAALADRQSSAYADFERQYTLAESIRFHASYRKYRPSEPWQRHSVTASQRPWSEVAYSRLGYGRWRDEIIGDHQSASEALAREPARISEEIAARTLSEARAGVQQNDCSARLSAEQEACRQQSARSYQATLELAVQAAANRRGISETTGANLAVALDDFRRSNPEVAATGVLSEREVRDLALTLDRDAVFRNQNVSREAFDARLDAFSEHVSDAERIERRNNRDVLIIERPDRERTEIVVDRFEARIERARPE